MLGLGLPERLLGVDFSHHRTGPQTRGFDFGNRRECRLLLLFVRVEDGRTVARPEVAPLLLVGCRVVNLEEAFNIKEAGDGLSGEEGTQYLHVWLVEALTRAGRHDRSRLEEARLIFERRSALPTMLASTRKAPGIAATPANEGAAQVCATSAEGQFQKKRIGLGAAGVDLWPG
jgi:hypothetical protein